MPNKYSKNLHHMLLEVLEGQAPLKFPVKCRRAETKVVLDRKLADVMKGKKGMAISCANARCALREGAKKFPHPVHMAEFTDRRAYIVDKLKKNGHPYSCVVYDHHQGDFQKDYDTKPKSLLAKMSGVERGITLYPPARNLPGEGDRNGRQKPAGRPWSGVPSKNIGGRRSKKAIGSVARLERAGVFQRG